MSKLSGIAGTGDVLCEFLNCIRPGLVAELLCKASAKPFEQMASVEGYIKGCATLGVKLKFNTVDHDQPVPVEIDLGKPSEGRRTRLHQPQAQTSLFC